MFLIPAGGQKVFTFGRNQCSRSSGIVVHIAPESLFTFGRNMQLRAAACGKEE